MKTLTVAFAINQENGATLKHYKYLKSIPKVGTHIELTISGSKGIYEVREVVRSADESNIVTVHLNPIITVEGR